MYIHILLAPACFFSPFCGPNNGSSSKRRWNWNWKLWQPSQAARPMVHWSPSSSKAQAGGTVWSQRQVLQFQIMHGLHDASPICCCPFNAILALGVFLQCALLSLGLRFWLFSWPVMPVRVQSPSLNNVLRYSAGGVAHGETASPGVKPTLRVLQRLPFVLDG